ncbi:endonuclease VIII [Brenneria sp. 4F2]|nr:endonuclease VIII [Brenneria bubanii]
MPEGPEIRRAADKLAAAMVGKRLSQVWFAFPELKAYEPQLIGQRVEKIATRGKALLTYFSNGLVLYSHNQLYGLWRLVNAGDTPQSKRDLRVRLENSDRAALLYSASDIEMLTMDSLSSHPFLQRIGPDVLDLSLTTEQVRERLCSARFRRRQFSSLLLDQSFLAGLGNYLRIEILWQARLAPQHNAQGLSEAQLQSLSQALLDIPRLSYNTRGAADENRHHGAVFSFKVFHREGEPCPRCGHLIEKTMLAGRPFYGCPGCQT